MVAQGRECPGVWSWGRETLISLYLADWAHRYVGVTLSHTTFCNCSLKNKTWADFNSLKFENQLFPLGLM